jgi:hypothetical protein
MPESSSSDVKTFPVDTPFQQMARRPGGVPRVQALERAQMQIDDARDTFGAWFSEQVAAIAAALPADGDSGTDAPRWVETASSHARQLHDIGTTMGYQLVTFIAGNFCDVLDAIRNGAAPNRELIDLHVEALRMSKQEKYQRLTPADFPELSSGLNKLLLLAKAGAEHRQDN